MRRKALIFFVCFTFLFLLPGNIAGQGCLPSYLKPYESSWNHSPKEASLSWFKDAGFGMFVHFSLASMLPGGTDEYAELDTWFKKQATFEQMDRYAQKQQLLDKMTNVSPEVEKLIASFNPAKFNADSIAELAVSAGMKYISFTTQHVCGKIFMYNTSLSKWNSKRLFNRDFVKELSEACERRGLGLFLYITPPNDYIKDEVKVMLRELLTNYGAIAGIWFDGIGECYRHPNDFLESGELYAYARELQSQCLISFKTGFTGDEDFLAPEWSQVKYDKKGNLIFNIHVATDNGMKIIEDSQLRPVLRMTGNGLTRKLQSFKDVWEKELSKKPVELCNTILKKEQWFDVKDGIHKNKREVKAEYDYARKNEANYLLNIALRGDGSIHPADQLVLHDFAKLKD